MSHNVVASLYNFDDQSDDTHNDNKTWPSKFSEDELIICNKLLSTGLDQENLVTFLKTIQDDNLSKKKICHLAVSALLSFCDYNWNTNQNEFHLESYFNTGWPKDIDVHIELQCDSEPLLVNILYPELLYFSTQVLGALQSIDQNMLHLWWYFRSRVIHQRALEDTCSTLYTELEILIAKLSNELLTLEDTPRLQILLCLELAQGYLLYGRVQKVDEFIMKAKKIAGLKLELTGILGKRTKFQQQSLPQLALSSELNSDVDRPSAATSHGSLQMPQEIALDDDVRLDKIQYAEKVHQAELPSLEQTLCLLIIQYLQKSQPKDNLATEEIQPYIELVLSQKNGAWATHVAALLIRCKLEATHKRTVERAMMQCETIVSDKTLVPATTRLSYLWASGLPPAWTWRQQLADLYLSLGLVKGALEEYKKLQLWEDVIVCYTLLQLRHKAAEIINQQIDIAPTVKLYCLLGDATDDVECYEKAWEFSSYKSSRAQRHWGNYLYEHKRYEECIPHFEKSVDINSIQESVWLRLGFAALETQQWELSAKAYRRYTYLQPNSFEAWNNLAKVYVKQDDKNRAYRALMEALRFNYDNWKLWENVILVSMDTGHFEDVIRGCHRLLDIKQKFEDYEVIKLLVYAILNDNKDADGNSAARLRKRVLELFGRITSIHHNNPEVWQLYSDLSPTYLLKAQRLLKAYKGYTQSGNWSSNPDTSKKVIELVKSLLDNSLKARHDVEDLDKLQVEQQLSSARLTCQAVIRAVENQNWPETQFLLVELKEQFTNVTEYMKSVMYKVFFFYPLLINAFLTTDKNSYQIAIDIVCNFSRQ